MIHLKRVGFFFLVFIFLLPVFASTWEKPNGRLNLKAALLVDIDSGKILYKQNADKLIHPASLAKILVLYLVNEDIRAAGYHLVATAKRGDKRLMSVVLGAKNLKIRTSQTKKLLDFGFRMIGEKDQDSMVGA